MTTSTHHDWTGKALSLRNALKGLDAEEMRKALTSLPAEMRQKALTSPYIWGRDKQVEALTSDADTVLILCGRGWGKTWTGTHWLLDRVQRGHTVTAVVAETVRDVRDSIVDPAERGSGLVELARDKSLNPNYKITKSRITLQAPHGESRIQTYSRDKPDSLHGFSGSAVWIDGLDKMQHRRDVWDQVNLTLREEGGLSSQLLITTSSARSELVKELVADEDVHVIQGDWEENEANLGTRFKQRTRR